MTVLEIRYWAAIRAAAGCKQESLDVPEPITVNALAELLAQSHESPEFTRVLGVCSVLVDGQPVSPAARADMVIEDGQAVEFLPPFAGG